MADAVLTETRGRVLLITLNRPEAMNAIDTDLAQEVLAAVEQLDTDDGLTAGVMTGAAAVLRRMDLKAFAKSGPPKGMGEFFENGAQKPLIAIEGFMAGGLEMALSCDLLVAADNVKFGIPEAGVGLFAGGGALIRLPSRVGYMKAMEMALTADPISAQEAPASAAIVAAHRAGQGSRRHGAGRADRPQRPLSVSASKAIIRATEGMTEAEAWEYQKPHFAKVFTSEDAKEGPRAFAEKRAPEWSGK